MPDPLSADFAATLRSDPVAALAAAFIIETHHPNVLHWVARAVQPVAPKRRRRKRKANGVHKLTASADAYLERRRRKRDRDDEALVEQMRTNPEGSIGDWATVVGKSRTSIVSTLHRLRAAGMAESVEGRWRLTEAPAPRVAPPRWVEPVSVASRREHATA
jgi:hypothetical protein